MAKKQSSPAGDKLARGATPKQIKVLIGCPVCGAAGHVDGDRDKPFCPECKGSGKIAVPEEGATVCPKCEGDGEHKGMPCFPCASTGKVAGDAKAGELAEANALAEAEAATRELQAKLDEAFEKGRQSAFQDVVNSKKEQS